MGELQFRVEGQVMGRVQHPDSLLDKTVWVKEALWKRGEASAAHSDAALKSKKSKYFLATDVVVLVQSSEMCMRCFSLSPQQHHW